MSTRRPPSSIKVAQPHVGEEECEVVRRVLLSGQYVSGSEVEAFEDNFSRYVGVPHAVACNSGTAALHLALAASGIGPGDEVIVPPLTFFATVAAVLHQNAVPIFADVERDSYCLDPVDVSSRLTSRTRAIIAVHLFGNAANLDGILEVARKHNLMVIEDCAQAHGTEYNGRKVGSWGRAGTFSFFATKHITTGEGGMLVTHDKELAEKARIIRNHGMIGRAEHVMLGYNYRMNEMAAAMGLVQLSHLDELNHLRIRNSYYLLNRLEDIEWIATPSIKENVTHTFFWCPIFIHEEKLGFSVPDFIKKLRDEQIEVRYRYSHPLYRQKILINQTIYKNGCPICCSHYKQSQRYEDLYLPNAEEIAGKIIGIPNHPGLSLADLDYIIEVFHTIKNSQNSSEKIRIVDPNKT